MTVQVGGESCAKCYSLLLREARACAAHIVAVVVTAQQVHVGLWGGVRWVPDDKRWGGGEGLGPLDCRREVVLHSDSFAELYYRTRAYAWLQSPWEMLPVQLRRHWVTRGVRKN